LRRLNDDAPNLVNGQKSTKGAAVAEQALSYSLRRRRSVRSFKGKQLDLDMLKSILFVFDGITSEDGKRATPSANGLYPLSVLLAVGDGEFLKAGVYEPERGSQSLTQLGDNDVRAHIAKAAIGDQSWIQNAPCIITFFGDIERASQAFFDQPPKGERGERYVYLEAGAAAQNMMLQATSLGVGSVLVAGIDEKATAQAYEHTAPEQPLLHVCLGWPLDP
jgi:SagB-type dehydrogenase family enzyme